MSSFTKVPKRTLTSSLQLRAAALSQSFFSLVLFTCVSLYFFYSSSLFLYSLDFIPAEALLGLQPSLYQLLLALPPLVALLELPQPAAPQVLPRDEQASLVRNYAALSGGVVVVVRAQEKVLSPRFDLGAFARYIFGAHPQQLVSPADAVLALFVDRYDVDGEPPPLARLVSL